jgi:hypothetical protein
VLLDEVADVGVLRGQQELLLGSQLGLVAPAQLDLLRLEPGETLRLRYAVVLHGPLPSEQLVEFVERICAEPAR